MSPNAGHLVRQFSRNLCHYLSGQVLEELPDNRSQSPVFRGLVPGRNDSNIHLLAYARTMQFFGKDARTPKIPASHGDSFIIIGVDDMEVSPLTFEILSCQLALSVVTLIPAGGAWDLPDYDFGDILVKSAYGMVEDRLAYYVSLRGDPNPGELTDHNSQKYSLEILFELGAK